MQVEFGVHVTNRGRIRARRGPARLVGMTAAVFDCMVFVQAAVNDRGPAFDDPAFSQLAGGTRASRCLRRQPRPGVFCIFPGLFVLQIRVPVDAGFIAPADLLQYVCQAKMGICIVRFHHHSL
jgi:hypothetical protein